MSSLETIGGKGPDLVQPAPEVRQSQHVLKFSLHSLLCSPFHWD